MKRSQFIISATVMAAAVALAVPGAASARVPLDPIVSGLAGPLQIDLGSSGQIYVAQGFSGVLTKVRPNGTTKDLLNEPGLGGVASRGYDVAYTVTKRGDAGSKSLLKRRDANGTVSRIANLSRYEENHNPDADQVYGFRNLTDNCAAQVPPRLGGEPYTGLVDSNPYAVANAPGGGWYVADAGGNDILHVTRDGAISVFAVLRPRKSVVTAEAAEALGLPNCTVGETYAFEAVPTDVEVKSTGSLIVSLLPGGPEDASLGARGAVVRLAGDGEFTNVAQGFIGATNVALAPGGRIFVAELFGNKVSMIQNHEVTRVRRLPFPAGLEFGDGKLYASIDVFANGSVVKFRP